MLKSPLQFEAEELLNKLNDAITAGDRAKALDLTDKLELFLKPLLESGAPDMWEGYGLTRREQRIVSALFARKGNILSREGIMQAVYFDHVDDWPHDKILDVFIMRARAKLLAKGEYQIDTVWGQGFRLRDAVKQAQAA